MKGYMYILKCADGSYYTGSTKDLERRLQQHQNGEGANHTKKRLPVELVYFEVFDRIDHAFYREKQIQGWSRKKKEALMRQDFDALHELAKCRNESAGFGSAGFGSAGFDSAQPADDGKKLPERQPKAAVLKDKDAGFGSAQPAGNDDEGAA
jgi:putative endonuclease